MWPITARQEPRPWWPVSGTATTNAIWWWVATFPTPPPQSTGNHWSQYTVFITADTKGCACNCKLSWEVGSAIWGYWHENKPLQNTTSLLYWQAFPIIKLVNYESQLTQLLWFHNVFHPRVLIYYCITYPLIFYGVWWVWIINYNHSAIQLEVQMPLKLIMVLLISFSEKVSCIVICDDIYIYIYINTCLTHWSLLDVEMIVSKPILRIDIFICFGAIGHRWVKLNSVDDKQPLLQVTAWCRRATIH